MDEYKKGDVITDENNNITESRTYGFPEEYWNGSEYNDLPCQYSWPSEEALYKNKSSELFLVYGTIIEEDINTGFKFNKAFKTVDAANFYFDVLKDKHPKSHILLAKKTFQHVRTFC